MSNRWSETELAYLAGIVDGEGCFAMHKRGHHYGTQIEVGNTDLLLMDWLKSHFGGTVSHEPRSNKKHQDIWRWRTTTDTLEVILQSLIPYLIVKKRQAQIMLAYRATVNVGRSTARKSDAVKQERREMYAEMTALKRPHLVA